MFNQPSSHAPRLRPGPGKLKVLVVDDELLIRYSLQRLIDLPSYILAEKEALAEPKPPNDLAGLPVQPSENVNRNSLSLRVLEEESISAVLKAAKGNQREAAKLLDITRDRLRYRTKKPGIESIRYLLLCYLVHCFVFALVA